MQCQNSQDKSPGKKVQSNPQSVAKNAETDRILLLPLLTDDVSIWGFTVPPEAEKEYRRVVAEWNTGMIAPKPARTENITVAELVLRFLKERKGKASPTQWDHERRIASVLVSIYGDSEAVAFDINCLRTIRNEFIQKSYIRQKINWRIRIIQSIFRWGGSYKIVPSNVWHELKTLIPIKKGEYDLPESKERQTVSLTDIQKTLAELSPVIREWSSSILQRRQDRRKSANCGLKTLTGGRRIYGRSR